MSTTLTMTLSQMWGSAKAALRSRWRSTPVQKCHHPRLSDKVRFWRWSSLWKWFLFSFHNITYWTPFPRWVPEDRQECKENVEQCVNVTKPYCREVEELLIETIWWWSIMNLQVLDHVCKEKLTFRLEKKCNTRDVKEVNIVAANATIRLSSFCAYHPCA